MRYYEAASTINASPEAVWSVLSDGATWSSWDAVEVSQLTAASARDAFRARPPARPPAGMPGGSSRPAAGSQPRGRGYLSVVEALVSRHKAGEAVASGHND